MIPSLLSPSDLQIFMEAHHIAGEILKLSVPTPTVETAAQALGVHPEQIVKSILFLVDQRPALAIAGGAALVDRRAVAACFGVGRKRVKLASAAEVLEIAGYEVGAMPPFGHRQTLPTLLDPGVLGHTTIYAGGGAENAMARLHTHAILRITQATVVSLRIPNAASEAGLIDAAPGAGMETG